MPLATDHCSWLATRHSSLATALMSPAAIVLGTLAVLGFLMTALGFVALVWRVSWGVRSFAELEHQRAANEEKLLEMLSAFVESQRMMNESVETSLLGHGKVIAELREDMIVRARRNHG